MGGLRMGRPVPTPTSSHHEMASIVTKYKDSHATMALPTRSGRQRTRHPADNFYRHISSINLGKPESLLSSFWGTLLFPFLGKPGYFLHN